MYQSRRSQPAAGEIHRNLSRLDEKDRRRNWALNMEKGRTLSLIKRLFLGLALVLILLYIWVAFSIYTYGRKFIPCEAETAIVLGAAVWDSEPSPVFQERINHAISLYKNSKIKKIIFTGGVGEGDQLSEAEAGRTYAVQNGVKAEDIFIETRSWTTYQNLLYSKDIVSSNNLGRVMIISDPLHLKRAAMIAHGLDISACTSATPTTRYQSLRSKLPFLLRESYYFLEHFIIKV